MSLTLSYAAAEQRRSWVEQVSENSARLARVALFVESTGSGEYVMTEPIPFGISFTDVPHFSSGAEVKSELTAGHYPFSHAFVRAWQFNGAHTLCVGVYLGFIVDDAEGNLPHRVAHHLRFEGDAIKIMPPGAI